MSPGQGLISFDSDKRGRRASNTRHVLVNILQYCTCDCTLKRKTTKASLTKMIGLMSLCASDSRQLEELSEFHKRFELSGIQTADSEDTTGICTKIFKLKQSHP